MTQPEYIAALLSVIVGLGLTDLAQSLRELLHNCGKGPYAGRGRFFHS